MTLIKAIYIANILILGIVGLMSLFAPRTAQSKLFAGFSYSDAIRLVGALYVAILVISVIGLFFPLKMSVLLLFQLIYKVAWLLFAALPAVYRGKQIPKIMTVVFIVYVAVLPFAVPWGYLWG